MCRIQNILLTSLFLVGYAASANVQAEEPGRYSCNFSEPASSNCAAPQPIPGSVGHHVVMMDVQAATDPGTMCDPPVPVGHKVYFSLRPDVTGWVTVSTCHPATAYDTVVEVATGVEFCSTGTVVGYNDDTLEDECPANCGGRASKTWFYAYAGQNYIIRVGSYNSNPSSCHLCLGLIVTVGDPCGDPPREFLCQMPRELPGTPGTHYAEIDVEGAPSNVHNYHCVSGVGHHVWFSFVPTISGFAAFSTCVANTTYNTVVQALSGDCSGMMQIRACNDDSWDPGCGNECGGQGSKVSFSVDAGQTYYLEVGAFGDNSAVCDLCLGGELTIGECSDTSHCDDGNPCTEDVCADGMCAHNALPSYTPCPDDGEPCTEDYCYRSACIHPDKQDYTACGDQSNTACTDPDVCLGGTCLPRHASYGTVCTPDSNECTSDICDGSGSCTHPNAAAGTACGDPSHTDCNNPDTCNGAGGCMPNYEPTGAVCTDDGNDCTRDVCDGDGSCTHYGETSGTPCGDQSNTDCTDPDICDGGVTCLTRDDPYGTVCSDDGNQCTNDVCNGGGTCTHPPETSGTACGDASDTDCTDPDTCNGAGSCLPMHTPYGTVCTPDSNECTSDICDGSGSCTHPNAAAGTACGDPSHTDCSNPDTCNGAGACMPNYEPTGTVCTSDSNDCTRDICNGAGTCTHGAEANGTPCDDASDTDCTDPDECDGTGTCQQRHEPVDTPCGDDLFCNGVDTCDGDGNCRYGVLPCQPDEVCVEDGDRCDPDCNVNGVSDLVDIESGTSADCNEDGVPDECQGLMHCSIVNPDVKPRIDTLPSMGGGPDRVVAAVRAPDGGVDEFIVDEVVLLAPSERALEAFVATYGAEVVSGGPLPEPPPSIPPDIVRTDYAECEDYLVRVDVEQADLSSYSQWMEELGLVGTFEFSTEEGVKLSAIIAKETVVHGLSITPNLIVSTPSADCVLSETSEYLHPDTGEHVNGFNFGWLRDAQLQVTRAWQYYDLLGLPPNPVYLSIVDAGFMFNADFPSPAGTPQYNFPAGSYDVDGAPNPSPCFVGGAPGGTCSWHGTGAYGVAAAILDNDFGSAGTSGPVGSPMLIQHDGTLKGAMKAVSASVYWGADVINCNVSGRCSSWCDFFGGDNYTKKMVNKAANAGVVVTVPADNTGASLSDFYQIPCEVANALCVGGIDINTKQRHGSSNWGGAVDMWAPFNGLGTTPMPVTVGPLGAFGGTCGSSAYLAGVVTLVRATNPSLTPPQVLGVLQATANSSTDPLVTPGFVNAYEAVKSAADMAGRQPQGDMFEPNDTDSTARTLATGTVTATITPGDADNFTFTTIDYKDFQLSVTAKDTVTPGNGLYVEFDDELPLALQNTAVNLNRLKLKPGRHVITVWGQTSDAINCYTFTWSMTTSTILPDRFDDQTPPPEQRNDSLASPAVIADEICPQIAMMTGSIDDLNHDVVGDVDFFEVKIRDSDTSGDLVECCDDVGPDTTQGRFRLRVQPDTVRPFEIVVYRPDDTVLHTGSGLSYTLECPHEVFGNGVIRFSVRDKTSRNFYRVALGYNLCDTHLYPNWFLEYDPPPFRWIIPEFVTRYGLMFPADPDVQGGYFAGTMTEPFPDEYLPFEMEIEGDYLLDIELPGYCAGAGCLDIVLISPSGEPIATAGWVTANRGEGGGPGTKRLEAYDLSPGMYFLKIEGASFGTYYTLHSVVTGDTDADQDVDLLDVAVFHRCFGGPADEECEVSDLSRDGAIGLADVPLLNASLSGPR